MLWGHHFDMGQLLLELGGCAMVVQWFLWSLATTKLNGAEEQGDRPARWRAQGMGCPSRDHTESICFWPNVEH